MKKQSKSLWLTHYDHTGVSGNKTNNTLFNDKSQKIDSVEERSHEIRLNTRESLVDGDLQGENDMTLIRENEWRWDTWSSTSLENSVIKSSSKQELRKSTIHYAKWVTGRHQLTWRCVEGGADRDEVDKSNDMIRKVIIIIWCAHDIRTRRRPSRSSYGITGYDGTTFKILCVLKIWDEKFTRGAVSFSFLWDRSTST